jgi:hypothetical protein
LLVFHHAGQLLVEVTLVQAVEMHQMKVLVDEERWRMNGNHSGRWRAWTVGAGRRGQDRHVTLARHFWFEK